jgi:hypothetical protein
VVHKPRLHARKKRLDFDFPIRSSISPLQANSGPKCRGPASASKMRRSSRMCDRTAPVRVPHPPMMWTVEQALRMGAVYNLSRLSVRRKAPYEVLRARQSSTSGCLISATSLSHLISNDLMPSGSAD